MTNTVLRRNLLSAGAAAAMLAAAGMPSFARAKQGGLLRAALPGGMAGFDPRKMTGNLFAMAAAQGAVFDTLTQIGPDGVLQGELARDWRSDPSGLVWDITLRADALFHNGKSFDARDAAASLRLHQDPRSGAYHITNLIKRIQTPSRHRLRITLHSPRSDFPLLLSDYHLIMLPAPNIDRAMADGIGTGLYRPVHLADSLFEGRRVSAHYKDGQAGWFDEIRLTAVPDLKRGQDLLLARKVDAALTQDSNLPDGFTARQIPAQVTATPDLSRDPRPFAGHNIAHHTRLHIPASTSAVWPMDGARMAERWWMA